jgi:hypothetical protein
MQKHALRSIHMGWRIEIIEQNHLAWKFQCAMTRAYDSCGRKESHSAPIEEVRYPAASVIVCP